MTITDMLADLEAKARQATSGPWFNTQVLEVEHVEESLPGDFSAPRVTRSYVHMVGPRKPFKLSPTGYADEYIAKVGANDADYIASCSPDRILALVAWTKELSTAAHELTDAVDTIWGLEAVPDEDYDAEVGHSLDLARKKKLEAFRRVRELLAAHLDAEEGKA